MGQHPLVDHRHLVSGRVVADHVHVQAGIDLAVDLARKASLVRVVVLSKGSGSAPDVLGTIVHT
jgi:hypothetical protein